MEKYWNAFLRCGMVGLVLIFFGISSNADNGYKLWLRFQKMDVSHLPITSLYIDSDRIAGTEFREAWQEVSGDEIEQVLHPKDGTLIIADSKSSVVQTVIASSVLDQMTEEGYLIYSISDGNQKQTLITAKSDAGLLYGTFHLLRLIQMGNSIQDLSIVENPSYDRRLLNHWDNLNRTVERGYAGYSIWRWNELPEKVSPRYRDYARANASIGINGTVLNNVNAAPEILSPEYLEKVKVIADELRPYHIRVYLSVNFSSPKALGGLENSDPLNPEVVRWWKDKAAEIYQRIPDFGGFWLRQILKVCRGLWTMVVRMRMVQMCWQMQWLSMEES